MERIELEQAIKLLEERVTPLTRTETVSLFEGLGRYLAEDFVALINVPNFNRSAMDGYAVVCASTIGANKNSPVVLDVLGEYMAGDATLNHQTTGAIRVMTGAKIPDGFDGVIRQEDTNYGEDKVEIYTEITPFSNYGKIGEDTEKGMLLIKKHTKLTPIHLGMLSGQGVTTIKVFDKLKVGLMSTGSELITPGVPLKDAQIYNTNQIMLQARLQELGATVVFAQSFDDNSSVVVDYIKNHHEDVDFIVTTGGVSVGVKDILHDVIDQLKATRLFWRVNLRPGTPALATIYKTTPILSLSGNPFAALTTFELLARPMMAKFTGDENLKATRKNAIIQSDFNKKSKQRRFVRGVYESGKVTIATSAHQSSVLSSMAGCNCMLDIKAGNEGLKTGDEVNVVLL